MPRVSDLLRKFWDDGFRIWNDGTTFTMLKNFLKKQQIAEEPAADPIEIFAQPVSLYCFAGSHPVGLFGAVMCDIAYAMADDDLLMDVDMPPVKQQMPVFSNPISALSSTEPQLRFSQLVARLIEPVIAHYESHFADKKVLFCLQAPLGAQATINIATALDDFREGAHWPSKLELQLTSEQASSLLPLLHQQLQNNAFEACYFGGVDCLLEQQRCDEIFARNINLRNALFDDGVVPGEGGAVLLLQTKNQVPHAQQVTLRAVQQAPTLGESMMQATRQMQTPVDAVITSGYSGQSAAKEWHNAVQHCWPKTATPPHYATHWTAGELGAANLPLQLTLACVLANAPVPLRHEKLLVCETGLDAARSAIGVTGNQTDMPLSDDCSMTFMPDHKEHFSRFYPLLIDLNAMHGIGKAAYQRGLHELLTSAYCLLADGVTELSGDENIVYAALCALLQRDHAALTEVLTTYLATKPDPIFIALQAMPFHDEHFWQTFYHEHADLQQHCLALWHRLNDPVATALLQTALDNEALLPMALQCAADNHAIELGVFQQHYSHRDACLPAIWGGMVRGDEQAVNVLLQALRELPCEASDYEAWHLAALSGDQRFAEGLAHFAEAQPALGPYLLGVFGDKRFATTLLDGIFLAPSAESAAQGWFILTGHQVMHRDRFQVIESDNRFIEINDTIPDAEDAERRWVKIKKHWPDDERRMLGEPIANIAKAKPLWATKTAIEVLKQEQNPNKHGVNYR